jgi:hypothetical protein
MLPRSIIAFLPNRGPILLTAAVALVVTQFPLLNVLGLEYAAAMAPFVSFVAGWIFSRQELPLRFRTWLQWIVRAAGLSLPPLVVGLIAAVFIRNCSLLQGVADYLLVVPPAAVVGLSLAVLARGLAATWPRTMFVLLWLAVLVPFILGPLFGPQIFSFNLIVGFFPGFSYDESLGLPGSLIGFRAVTLWFAATAMVAGAQMVRARQEKRRFLQRRTLIPALASGVVLLAVWWQADRFGWSSSLDRIERELGGRRDGEHLVILFPEGELTDEQADRLLAYHEFTYERIRRTLRVRPERKSVSVLYKDAGQKNHLAGGGRTNFAKPWLGQVHLLLSDVQPALRHELVHVLAADFGVPLLGIGVNGGVIEGLAVALERTTGGESVHRAAAQVLAAGYRGAVEDLFSTTGFFSGNASASYALAGSFSRYLIERFGMQSFKTFYRTGDAQRAFFHDLSALAGGWRRRIDEIPLTVSDTAKAVYLYTRPPLQARECARVIGDLHAGARAAFSGRRDVDGLALAQRSWSLTRSPEAAGLVALGLARTGEDAELLSFVGALRGDTLRWPYVRTLDVMAGDAWWRMDSLVPAASAYERVRELGLSQGWTEMAAFRWEALTKWGWDRPLVAAVVGLDPDSIKRRLLEAAALAEQGGKRGALLRYAAARLISSEREPASVIRLLRDLPSLGRDVLDHAARRKLASASIASGAYGQAKAALWESLNFTSSEADMIEVSEMIAYCDWLMERMPPPLER